MAMRSIVFALALGAAACGSSTQNSNKTTMAKDPNDQMVCKQEATTGTNITHTVCRSQAEIDEERQGAQNFYQDPRATPSHNK
jgi:hypothetical protein